MEGPGQPSHSLAVLKAGLEGVCPQPEPPLASLGFGLEQQWQPPAHASEQPLTVEYVELKY